jgi:site-specific recombinase XerD
VAALTFAHVQQRDVFRPVNRADRMSGEILSEKVVWQLIKPYAEVAGIPGHRATRSPQNLREAVSSRRR